MRRIAESELIINGDGNIFHLHLKPEEIADTIILVGDPGRVDLVASYFDTKEFKRENREIHTITGSYKGRRMTVLSTGMGCDNIDIVVNELDALANIDFQTRTEKEEKKSLRIVRLGTCGAVQPDIPVGSFILSHYSVGCDGLLNWYADREQVTNQDMEEAFMNHIGWTKYLPSPYFIHSDPELISLFEEGTVKGMTISASGFYGPQGRVLRIPLAIPDLIEKLESYRFGDWRITNIEMEGSALAGLCAKLGHKATTLCTAIANRHCKDMNTDYKKFIEEMVVYTLDRLSL